MKPVKPDPRLAGPLSEFMARTCCTARLGRGDPVQIHLLKRASPDLLDLLLPNLSPQDYYVTERGVGIGVESVRLLRVQFEPLLAPDDADDDLQRIKNWRADRGFSESDPVGRRSGVDTVATPSSRTHPPKKPDRFHWQVCNADQARTLLKEGRSGEAERMRVLRQLAEHSQRRLPRVTPAKLRALERMVDDFPNFKPAIDEVLLDLRFQHATRMPVALPHLLLAGPPGVGKTEFARRLAEVLGLHFEMRSLAEITASFAITGNHRGWHGAMPGLIAKAVAEAPAGLIPMVLFDELDKVHTAGNHPPDTALLGLLERRTAEHFRDECLDFEINVRPMAFVFTCNELDRIMPAIRSRLRVIRIDAPSKQQMPAVVRSVDRGVREAQPAISALFHPLSDEVIARLREINPRALSGVLLRVYAIATAARGRGKGKRLVSAWQVEAAIRLVSDKARVSFGFVPPDTG